MTFNIPFTVGGGAGESTVELYVSSDRGHAWQFHSRQPATVSQFPFHAASAGEYWFASRLAATNGPATRAENLNPELRVLIDVEEPHLSFESKVGPAGRDCLFLACV
jgi:hypothetical protein